jgi:hypothetical protein
MTTEAFDLGLPRRDGLQILTTLRSKGVKLPNRAVPTACRICSSVESMVIGGTEAAGCGGDAGAGCARGELQPGSHPMRTSATTHVSHPREQFMLVSRRGMPADPFFAG